jgi:hypothetical protein
MKSYCKMGFHPSLDHLKLKAQKHAAPENKDSRQT